MRQPRLHNPGTFAGKALPACLVAALMVGAGPATLRAQGLDGVSRSSDLNPLSSLDLSALSAFRDRPLFTPSRRPPAPPIQIELPVARGDTDSAPNVRLAGIVRTPSGTIATLRDLDAGSNISVREGDRVGSWTVTTIGPAAVRLTRDGRHHYLKLFQPGGDQPPAAASFEFGTADAGRGNAPVPR